ncbi:MAG: ABC transporter substrate-binding protein [Spirochaetaceae bacterium]|jgi:branched-chain amino acid transport system substrate-binding protein|nr:ABC transporter substrate-binding protein [Spirochaetaceae bacterium]
MKKLWLAALIVCCAASLAFAGGGQAASGTAASDTVAIGAVFPLSGSVAFYGTESRDGALLAIDEINAAGGLLGKKLTLIAEDDEGNAEKSVNAFTKLATRDKVSFVLGSSTSGATMAMTSLAQQNKVVLISPSATALNITDAGDYIFRACLIDPFQGTVGADFAYDTLGSRKAAVLYDAGSDYNTGLADAFKLEFAKIGGQVVADEAYQTGDVDFNAQVTRIKAANPDLVYLPNYYNDVTLQAKQLRAQGITCALLGGDGWDSLIDNAGDEVLNGFWSSGFAADTTDPRGQTFVKAYEAKFNKPASQFAALGYDSLMLVADGIKAAGSFDSAAVKDAMAKLNGTYITGSIRFDSHRDPIKGAAILEIVRKDGKLTNVYKATVNPK